MTVGEKVGMPLDEFIRETNEQMFELINGERIPRLPTITRHNDTIDKLTTALKLVAEVTGLGIVRAEATFILPDHFDTSWVTGSRTPDILYITAERLEAYKLANPEWQDTPYIIVPDLVVEVISPNDKFTEVIEKVNAYLVDGVRLIVVLDPKLHQALIYTPDAEHPLNISGDAILDLSDVIAGFQIPLSKLFE
jgi:Uma2 family endonuclease